MERLRDLPNIGRVNEEKLAAVGIETPDQLRDTGSREAFVRLRGRDPEACLNLLCSLEGAIRGVRWHDLPPETKTELKAFHRSL